MNTPLAAMLAALTLTASLSACAGAVDESADMQSNIPAPVRATATGESSAPVELTLPFGDSAAIETVDTDESGVLLPPEDVTRLGWWVDSALPGDPGTVVVTGHVNSRGQGDGFAGLFTELDPGDRVSVGTSDGAEQVYVVDEVANYDKTSGFPAERLNALDGEQVLALITCGGEFVGPPLGYEDNVIAWATLEEGP